MVVAHSAWYWQNLRMSTNARKVTQIVEFVFTLPSCATAVPYFVISSSSSTETLPAKLISAGQGWEKPPGHGEELKLKHAFRATMWVASAVIASVEPPCLVLNLPSQSVTAVDARFCCH